MDRVSAERAEALRETRGDLLAFVGAFGVGLLLYVLLHVLLDVRQAVVTFAILFVMAAYAWLAAKTARFRVRLDQAGDNAYYLGLLFTLTSMAFALYEFGVATDTQQTGVEQIISNFGIALASTVAGIFLRVFLHQMRVDPADVENMTRIELSDASKRVRASLDTVYLDFGRFHDEVRQRTGDVIARLMTDTASSMGNVTSELAAATKTLLEATAANQKEILHRTAELTRVLESGATAATGAIANLKEVSAPPAVLAKQLQELSTVIGKLNTDLEATNQKFAGAAGRLERVGTALERDHELFEALSRSMRTAAEEAALAQTAATEVLSRLTTMTRALADTVRSASGTNGDSPRPS
jgi:biopolymer transport protein ExbB/TolQ